MKTALLLGLMLLGFFKVPESTAGEHRNLISSNLVETFDRFYNVEYAKSLGDKNAIAVYLGRTISNRDGNFDSYKDRKILDLTVLGIFYRRYVTGGSLKGAYGDIGLSFTYGNLWNEYNDIQGYSPYGPYPQYAYDLSDLLISVRSGYGWTLGRLYVSPIAGIRFSAANRDLLGKLNTNGPDISSWLIDTTPFLDIKIGLVLK
jgi:hypothetical protein